MASEEEKLGKELETGESDTTSSTAAETIMPIPRSGLKKIAPYWYPYKTMAKGRWFNREILELVSTEFRDRSLEYYVRACVCFE